MTVRELIELLEQFDGNKDVVVCPDNHPRYVYAPGSAREKEMNSFWGNDREVVCLFCNEQIGSV